MRAWLDALRTLAPVDRLQALQEQLVRGVFLPADVVTQVTGQLAEPLREKAQGFRGPSGGRRSSARPRRLPRSRRYCATRPICSTPPAAPSARPPTSCGGSSE